MPAKCLGTAHSRSSGEGELSKVPPFICGKPKLLPQLRDGQFQQQGSTARGRQGVYDKPLATANAAGAEGNQQALAREKNTVDSDVRTGGMETSKKAG